LITAIPFENEDTYSIETMGEAEHTATIADRMHAEHNIIYVMGHVAPVRNTVMQMLSASDLALFMATIRLTMTDSEKKRYLHVLRDIPEYESWVSNALRNEHMVLLVGADALMLKQRIEEPIEFWSVYGGKETITLWLVGMRRCGPRPRVDRGDEAWIEGQPHLYRRFPKMLRVPGMGQHSDSVERWFKSTIPNENRIHIAIWYAGYAVNENCRPNVFPPELMFQHWHTHVTLDRKMNMNQSELLVLYGTRGDGDQLYSPRLVDAIRGLGQHVSLSWIDLASSHLDLTTTTSETRHIVQPRDNSTRILSFAIVTKDTSAQATGTGAVHGVVGRAANVYSAEFNIGHRCALSSEA